MSSEIVVLMGCPGAGKTTTAISFYEKGAVGFTAKLLGGSPEDASARLDRWLSGNPGNQTCVLEDSYPSKKSRASAILVGKKHGIPVRCLWHDTSMKDAILNCCIRMVRRHNCLLGRKEVEDFNATTLDVETSYGDLLDYQKDVQEPSTTEGFSSVERLAFKRIWKNRTNKRAVIFDYDGTLRTTRSGESFPTNPDDVVVLDGRRETLLRLHREGFLLLGASNQSAVARGVSSQVVKDCFEKTNDLLGCDIDFLFCPHDRRRQECFCRKPMPGMAVIFIEKYKLDPQNVHMVGDQATDKGFADAAGIGFAFAREFFRG